MEDHIDKLLAQLGTGWWQILHFLTLSFASGIIVPHSLAGVYVAPRLKYECRLPPDTEERSYFIDNSSIPSCNYFVLYEDGTQNEAPCTEWDFDNSTFTNTVTSEFGLTCQRDYLRATYQSMYMIGVLVGSPINGILADRYGRKTMFTGSSVLYAILAMVSCWLPNIPSLLAFRFLLGTLHTSVLKTGYILAMEIASPKIRSIVGITLFAPWGLGTIAWGGLAYLMRSWRYLLTVGSLPCLVLLPPLLFLDESPRWLLVKGRHAHAFGVLKKAARWNKVTLPIDFNVLKLDERNVEQVPKTRDQATDFDWKTIVKNCAKGILILLRTPRLRLATLVMVLDYFVLGMVFFGISLSGGNLNFDIFSYVALMGLAEVPCFTVLYPIVSHFGRRLPIAICYTVTGVVLLMQPFLPSGNQQLVMFLVLTGKMAISAAFQGCNLYASELFPTEVRTSGVGTSFMLSRVGSAIAPFITDYLGVTYPWAPSVVFGLASASAGLATLRLWETRWISLPDTIPQLESTNFLHLKKNSNKIADDQTYTAESKVLP
ncbi:organic cation transporter protein-like [Macrobrachium rosenbergii]|uniref:organic cation transporter protein-like n=1 Tax=Macrobrachium rosenbergii TaxID=79674 RepID=UPI0034D3A0FF